MPRVKLGKSDSQLKHHTTSNITEIPIERKIAVMTPRQAADYLRSLGMSTSDGTIRRGLEQCVFPFGDAIKVEQSTVYYIYKTLLDKWIRERMG